ncbi:MAG: DUF4113 domain-containing protein [Pseudanabaenales cyanobacterium]|nr:DUF4113 domain-containing protein [Pseudanabaenales cyanobacterium]
MSNSTRLVPANTPSGNLFRLDSDPKVGWRLMQTIDPINRKLDRDAVKFEASGLTSLQNEEIQINKGRYYKNVNFHLV